MEAYKAMSKASDMEGAEEKLSQIKARAEVIQRFIQYRM